MSHFSHSIKKACIFFFGLWFFSPVFVWESKVKKKKKSFYYATLTLLQKHKTDYQHCKLTFQTSKKAPTKHAKNIHSNISRFSHKKWKSPMKSTNWCTPKCSKPLHQGKPYRPPAFKPKTHLWDTTDEGWGSSCHSSPNTRNADTTLHISYLPG